MRERHFTLLEANALLPWLEETFARLQPLREQLSVKHKDLLELLRQRSGNGVASKGGEVRDEQVAIERLTNQLNQEVLEITNKGIIVRDVGRGLVDFPAYRDDQEVYLCWLPGEKRIDFWHGTNEGFGSRKRL